MIKNLPAAQKTQVQSLGREDLLEKGMTTHSSILAATPAPPRPQKIRLKEIFAVPPVAQRLKHLPAMQETWVRSLGQESPRGGHGHPLQDFCLENSMARGAWRALVHRVTKSLDMTERLTRSLALLPAPAS